MPGTETIVVLCLVAITAFQTLTFGWALWFAGRMHPIISHFGTDMGRILRPEPMGPFTAEDLVQAQSNYRNRVERLQAQIDGVNERLAAERSASEPNPIRLEALEDAAAGLTEYMVQLEIGGEPQTEYQAIRFMGSDDQEDLEMAMMHRKMGIRPGRHDYMGA